MINFRCKLSLITTAIALITSVANAQIKDVEFDDVLAKSVAQIELPVSGTGMAKCSAAFIRMDAVITETHCVVNESITHRILIGPGPGYDRRALYLTRKVVLPVRFQKPNVAILFLRAKPGETVSDRLQLVQPLTIAKTSSYAWRVSRPMQIYSFGHRNGDTRLRTHSRIGTIYPWLSPTKITSPRDANSFVVPGDSGGAGFVWSEARWQLWSLVWSIDVDQDIFVHVHAFEKWIQSTLAAEPLDLSQP